VQALMAARSQHLAAGVMDLPRRELMVEHFNGCARTMIEWFAW
jgi:hypothetical protein